MNTDIKVHNLPIEDEMLIKDVVYVSINGFKKLYEYYGVNLNKDMIENYKTHI